MMDSKTNRFSFILISMLISVSSFAQAGQTILKLYQEIQSLKWMDALYPHEPKKLMREYEAYLEASFRFGKRATLSHKVPKINVLKQFLNHKLIALADYHTSDFIHAEIENTIQYFSTHSKKKLVFVAEFIHPDVQSELDQYIFGPMNTEEKELEIRLKHKEYFFSSYPFKTFYPILKKLREKKIKTIAVMAPEKDTHWAKLVLRDEYTLKVLSKIFQSPQHQVLLMMGSTHLTSYLGKRLSEVYGPSVAFLLNSQANIELKGIGLGVTKPDSFFYKLSNVKLPNVFYYFTDNKSAIEVYLPSVLNYYVFEKYPDTVTPKMKATLEELDQKIIKNFSDGFNYLALRDIANAEKSVSELKNVLAQFISILEPVFVQKNDPFYLQRVKDYFKRLRMIQ